MTMRHATMVNRVLRRVGGRQLETLTLYTDVYNKTTRRNVRTPTAYSVPVALSKREVESRDGAQASRFEELALISGKSLPAGVRPTKGAQLTVKGVPYEVLDVDVDEPGDTPLNFACRIAR